MRQIDELIDLMKQGWVSPSMALAGTGCMRLAARVHDIRTLGYKVISRNVKRKNRLGRTITYKEYRIKEEAA
jgi:hypothetical protein